MGAQRRLHQRTHVARQHFLAIGHPELGSAAQARDRAAARNDDLIGHVHAKRTEHLAALFLQLNELGGANAVNIRYHEIVECHARGTVFLAQVHIAKRRGKHGAQLVMGFQVHAEALPHFTIVCHVRFPLRAKAASHPWGHAHMRPSRSVSNNYHATNRQPTRNMGAKKKRRATVQNGGRAAGARALPRLRGIWGMRFGCRMTTRQNSSSNEALLRIAPV